MYDTPQLIGSALAETVREDGVFKTICYIDDKIFDGEDREAEPVRGLYDSCDQAGDRVRSQALLHGVGM
eukprot:45526-Eustigmatos_ZCMA.PRE.1